MADKVTIKEVRTYSTSKEGGGDYHLQEKGHWIYCGRCFTRIR